MKADEAEKQESGTAKYVRILEKLKPGELGLLRSHAGQGLDESVEGFDLFAGLWWPLRQQKGGPPPRREVAWLIAKLYAFAPIPHSPGDAFASQMRRCLPNTDPAREQFGERFDRLLALPLERLEPALQWGLGKIASQNLKLDWVKLSGDLARWGDEQTRAGWAEQFLENERGR